MRKEGAKERPGRLYRFLFIRRRNATLNAITTALAIAVALVLALLLILAVSADPGNAIYQFLASGSEFSLNLKDDTLLIMTGDKPVEQMWNEIIEDYQAEGLDEVIADVNAAVK